MREKGFSLIEILIVGLIFTIFALAITNTIKYCFKNVIESRNGEIATNLCQEEMEIIRKFPYEIIPCPATFTPTGYQKGSKDYPGYPAGNFPPVLYPATYTFCRDGYSLTNDPAMCTLINSPHDHKDLLVTIGVHGTQTTNGTRTITTQWVDDPNTTDTTEDYKLITVHINWTEGGRERHREISTHISKK